MNKTKTGNFMRRGLTAGLLCWSAAAAWATPAPSMHGTTQLDAQWVRPSHALLWKIERTGLKPSYIYATLHAEDARATDVSPIVLQAFQEAETYVMESVPEPEAAQVLVQSMFLPPEQNLRDVIGEELFSKSAALLQHSGLSVHVTERLRPWAVIVALNTPKRQDGAFLDVLLYAAALNLGKAVHGLETVREQLGPFQKMTNEDQIEILRAAVDNYPELVRRSEDVVREYWAKNLGAIEKLTRDLPTDEPGLVRLFKDTLIDHRNQRLVQRLMPRIEERSAFIAIGAEHLPGDGGVLRLLEQRGYRVSPVY